MMRKFRRETWPNEISYCASGLYYDNQNGAGKRNTWFSSKLNVPFQLMYRVK